MSPDPAERQLVELLYGRFIQRRDVMAVHDGEKWKPARRKRQHVGFTGNYLLQHLRGEMVLGTYLVDRDNRCKFYTLDLDLNHQGFSYRADFGTIRQRLTARSEGGAELEGLWPDTPEACAPREVWADPMSPLRPWLVCEVRALAEGLARRIHTRQGFPVAVAMSGGKGAHIHVFCGERAASEARALAHQTLMSWQGQFEPIGKTTSKWRDASEVYQNITIEVFPKQDSIEGDEYGNLVRLPLGVHPVSHGRSYFLDLDSNYLLHPIAELDATMALQRGCVAS